MKQFDLASWEHFEAAYDASGVTVPITTVWVDYEARRMWGQSPTHPDLVWLNPKAVPNRVHRGDSRMPVPDTYWRELIKSRDEEFLEKRKKAKDDEAVDAQAAAEALERLAAIPEPEVRSRPATLDEMPKGVKDLGRKAHAAGFRQEVRYSRGPRTDQYWRVVEISDCFGIAGLHADGRRWWARFITKTGQRGKQAGVVKWDREENYAMVDGIWTACNATELALYISDGSLTKETI